MAQQQGVGSLNSLLYLVIQFDQKDTQKASSSLGLGNDCKAFFSSEARFWSQVSPPTQDGGDYVVASSS